MDSATRQIAVGGLLVSVAVSADAAREESKAAQRQSHVDIEQTFYPSGWFGDGEYGTRYVDYSAASRTNPHTPPRSIKITYTFGPQRFAGIWWQNQPNNWGDSAGNNYSARGFRRVSFWARGATGAEVVEFKTGGINSPGKRYRDRFDVSTGKVSLTTKWTQYRIELPANADLGGVIGAFCWVAAAADNTGPRMTFYLDDLRLE
jgi:hypothetical protein